MKYIFYIKILLHFTEVMTILKFPPKFAEGRKHHEYNLAAASYDNPNFGQALLSHRFISSAKSLFNKDKPKENCNHDYGKSIVYPNEQLYYSNYKISDYSKNKDYNVGYYSMDNDDNSENAEEHSLIDSYVPVKNRLTKYKHRIPVQCMKINPLQLFCVHGDVIYKLKLPEIDLTEDEIGKLVETVYKEIEIKRKSSFASRNHKRDTNVTNEKPEHILIPLLHEENKPKIMHFSLPDDETDETKVNEEENKETSDEEENTADKGVNIEKTTEDKPLDYYNNPKEPPIELFYPLNGKNSYSSKWLSKRYIINKKRTKRRIVPPKCFKYATIPTKPSINKGKKGKCYLPKCGIHKCPTIKPCECAPKWIKPPCQTTCAPVPLILPPTCPSRCPIYKFTEPNFCEESTKKKCPKMTTTTTEDVEENGDEIVTNCPAERKQKKIPSLLKKISPKIKNESRHIFVINK